MSVNGVTGAVGTYEAYQTSQPASAAKAAEEQTKTESVATSAEAGVVYEPGKDTETATSPVKKTYTQNTDLIAKLKADQQNRQQQLQNIVEQLMTKQGQTYNNANGIWSILAGGKLEVDPVTQAQAQKDIAEDGYWGVEQTSSRIIDFATALTGGDPDKIEEMREAFKKGYKQAGGTWGGDLPEISQKTYDAVMEKFDKLKEDAGLTTEN
ncbi:MAG: hypothetical protein NC318_08185 [Blautia sp.]|nr:hypothetical protein [Lachnoclostridium sp.]MCM1211568.1 hypothetical protein [Blautia sp.]